ITASAFPIAAVTIRLAENADAGSTGFAFASPSDLRKAAGGWLPALFGCSSWQKQMSFVTGSGPGAPLYCSFLRTPIWGLVFVLYLYPAVIVLGKPVRRSRRRKRGLCIHCAYDLTGNVSGVCPECGETL